MPGESVNLGPCSCCGNPCRGWYCCEATGEVFYAANCTDLEEMGPCGGSISRESICFDRRVPSVLYAEFGGAMASLGTVEYHWRGGPFGIGFYAWGNAAGTGTVVGPDYVDLHVCGQSYGTEIIVCGGIPDGQLVMGFGAPGGGTVCALRLDPTFTVTSWEPFETNTITGLMGHESQTSCPCYNEEFTIKLTGGPNDIDPDTLLHGPYQTEGEAIEACEQSESESDTAPPCSQWDGLDLHLSYSCTGCDCRDGITDAGNPCGCDGPDNYFCLDGVWYFTSCSGTSLPIPETGNSVMPGTILSYSPLVVEFGPYHHQATGGCTEENVCYATLSE